MAKDESYLEDSCDRMKKPWNSTKGFEMPWKRFDNESIFSAFVDNVITDGEAFTMLINIIKKIDSLKSKYEESLSHHSAKQKVDFQMKGQEGANQE